jgi:hypothetical protein
VTAASVIPARAGTQGRTIAVVGAQGTGKTQLAAELASHFDAVGLRCTVTVIDATVLIEQQPSRDATLLMGLDLPGASTRNEEDAQLRSVLERAGIGYQVVYGSGAQRLQSALAALGALGVLPKSLAPGDTGDGAARAWVWLCEKCSDPECEHKLFAKLRQART